MFLFSDQVLRCSLEFYACGVNGESNFDFISYKCDVTIINDGKIYQSYEIMQL